MSLAKLRLLHRLRLYQVPPRWSVVLHQHSLHLGVLLDFYLQDVAYIRYFGPEMEAESNHGVYRQVVIMHRRYSSALSQMV